MDDSEEFDELLAKFSAALIAFYKAASQPDEAVYKDASHALTDARRALRMCYLERRFKDDYP